MSEREAVAAASHHDHSPVLLPHDDAAFMPLSYQFDGFVDCSVSSLSGSCNLKQWDNVEAAWRKGADL